MTQKSLGVVVNKVVRSPISHISLTHSRNNRSATSLIIFSSSTHKPKIHTTYPISHPIANNTSTYIMIFSSIDNDNYDDEPFDCFDFDDDIIDGSFRSLLGTTNEIDAVESSNSSSFINLWPTVIKQEDNEPTTPDTTKRTISKKRKSREDDYDTCHRRVSVSDNLSDSSSCSDLELCTSRRYTIYSSTHQVSSSYWCCYTPKPSFHCNPIQRQYSTEGEVPKNIAKPSRINETYRVIKATGCNDAK